jgi:hypothetical protein
MAIRQLNPGLVLVAALHAAAMQPAPNYGNGAQADHAVGFYDPVLQRVVLVGGAGDPKAGERDTVWSWSGVAWDVVTSAGPMARVNAGAAHEAGRGKAIVVGGARKTADGASWEVMGDCWEGDAAGWRQIADIALRDHHSLVEDGRGGILMFGGIPSQRSGPWPGDTWRFHDGRWSLAATDGPGPRGRTAMAYDGKLRQVVLFGGVSAPTGSGGRQTFFGDTWVWDGTAWRKAAEDGPPGRYAHGMVYDERAGVVLLYGGAAAHRDAPLADMWQWDGTRWTEIPLSDASPGHRYQPVMVYDRARERTILYGGIGGPHDTWEWDGRRWRRVA